MIRFMVAGLLAAACIAAPDLTSAKDRCPDGRTAAGQCVNSNLAESQRQSAVVHSQPKISRTHYPIVPGLDWIFRHSNPDRHKRSAAGAAGTALP
jgi:hypothetical protein